MTSSWGEVRVSDFDEAIDRVVDACEDAEADK